MCRSNPLPTWSNIPATMTERPQWVLWRRIKSKSEVKKILFRVTGEPADSTDPSTWSTFEEVCQAYDSKRDAGIGFVFKQGDGLVGIDLDGCRNPDTGKIEDWAQSIIDTAGSYAEISPSKTGVKIFCRASLPFSGKRTSLAHEHAKVCSKAPGIEIYAEVRYFAVTGERLEGFEEVRDAQALVDHIVEAYFPAATSQGVEFRSAGAVIERARKYLAKMPPAVSGESGHDTAFHTACILAKGFELPRQEALALLSEWNRTCKPAWSEKELEHKIDDAIDAPGETGYLRNVKPQRLAKIDIPQVDAPQRDEPIELADPWPEPMDRQAFHGLAGELVDLIAPQTEADPVALLAQFLTAFGNIVGAESYFVAEGARHPGRLFTCLVGATSKGRKGTSWAQTEGVLSQLDELWSTSCVVSGLSSGEGLIWQVRDPMSQRQPIKTGGRVSGFEEVETDAGVADKRLLVIESELGGTLRVMVRQNNTLTGVLRDAWDGKPVLRSLTKNSPGKASGAHISIIGHITRDELRRYLTETDMANGLANRFLWLCVRRSKCLPDGGAPVDFAPIVPHLRGAMNHAKQVGQLKRDAQARDLWHAVYPKLSDSRPGLLGAVTSRAEAQTMRLAILFALLNCSSVIREEHLNAALAFWSYAEASARYIFGSRLGDPTADAILAALRSAKPAGITRTEMRDLLGRHAPSAEIASALWMLQSNGQARQEVEQTGGRPAETWFAV